MSGASTVNIKPITHKQAQALWRCGIPLLWRYSFHKDRWQNVDYNYGSPLTQARQTYDSKYGVRVE